MKSTCLPSSFVAHHSSSASPRPLNTRTLICVSFQENPRQERLMFCPQCGARQTSDELRFCKACGANLHAVRQVLTAREAGEGFDWSKTWVAEMFLSEEERKRRAA